MRKTIEVGEGNVKVRIYTVRQVKKGRQYALYFVQDYSTGKRKQWTYADLAKAKEKAGEIAHAIACGLQRTSWIGQAEKLEITNALEALKPTGLKILPACQLFAEAVKVLGAHDQLLSACRYWADRRPDKPFTPKKAAEARKEFLARRKASLSERRFRTLTSTLSTFISEFGNRLLHEITTVEISDFVCGKSWAPKTRNGFLSDVSLLYRDAQMRGWVPEDLNPVKTVVRQVVKGSTIHVFEPREIRQILASLDAELVPFFSLWAFSGVRKEEISRLSWQQVNRGIETGSIYLEVAQAKTRQARCVPVMDNLKLWLQRFSKLSGPILPEKWHGIERLDELSRYISRRSGIVWRENAPRHSFGTYYFKVCKDPGLVVQSMGNSLEKFQRHYWNRSASITEEAAKEYFGIAPPQLENVIVLPGPASESASVPAEVSNVPSSATVPH